MSKERENLGGQIRRSVLRHDCADTPQNRVLAVVSNLWLHIHPARVPAHGLRFRFTLCAGGIAFLTFLITVGTGVLLMFYYRPSTLEAHGDVLALTQEVPFGAFMRALHRYAGDLMIVAVFVHMIRVLLAGAYRRPREFNWVVGVLLLVITLAIAFTGYLLPYSQKGYWAVTVASNMVGAAPLAGSWLQEALLGGATVGSAALVRFYVLHCVALPLAGALVMALHFWRVRKDGISEPL